MGGIALDQSGAIPMSKLLWSISYVFWMSGVGTLLLLLLHITIDGKYSLRANRHEVSLRGWRCAPVRLLLAAGSNPLALYIVSEVGPSLLQDICVSGANRPSCHPSN